MTPLPPPTTFAEGQRKLYGLMMIAAGMACGAMAVAMVIIFVWGGWPEARYEQILTILGIGFGGFLAGMMVVMVAMAVGGPVGRFKGGVTRGGLEFEASGDDEPRVTATAGPGGSVTASATSPKEEKP